jgi:alkylated DNA repair dioxygenase AlkB
MNIYQDTLFNVPPIMPPGFKYLKDFIPHEEEFFLMEHIKTLTLENFVYDGYTAKRRIARFGRSTPVPSFLLGFVERAARFAHVSISEIKHALISEYSPQTSIGWHRDQPPYESVIGISLGAPCIFRLRKKKGTKWERISLTLKPRSIYLMSGASRSLWQHSIPPVEALRYSITMRTVPAIGY